MEFNLFILTILSAFPLFYISSTQSLQTTTTTSATTPLDSDGQEVEPGLKYHITPVQTNDTGGGGGLSLATRNGFCPPYVVQENTHLSKGLPLRFLPLDNKQNHIYLSSDLNVVFNAATICVQSTVWKLSSGRDGGGGGGDMVAGRRYYVRSGGAVGRPGVDTVRSWFRIERVAETSYKIVFCPSVCSGCKVLCGDVGVLEENGRKWLALVDKPLVFTLKKGK